MTTGFSRKLLAINSKVLSNAKCKAAACSNEERGPVMRDNCVNISDVSSLTPSFCSAPTFNTDSVMRPMMLSLTVMVISASVVQCHEYYSGKCPDFSPMRDFDWGRFSGDWWAALKMNSRSSCIRYSYDLEDGERVVTETKLLPVIGRFGVPSAVKSRGSLTSARPGGPSSLMEVVWNTGPVSSANAAVMGPLLSDTEYVILDTDYTDKALICSCRDLNMGFFAANRRSCALLVVGIS